MRRRNVKKEKKWGAANFLKRGTIQMQMSQKLCRVIGFSGKVSLSPSRYPLPILLRSLSPKIANANNRGKDRPWLHRENERNEEGQPREACEE